MKLHFTFVIGLQLGIEGRCEPCPRGTFRTQGVQPACQSCPRGRTTLKVGASAVEECSLPVCTPGNIEFIPIFFIRSTCSAWKPQLLFTCFVHRIIFEWHS